MSERRWPAMNLVDLYYGKGVKEWNCFLTAAYKELDMNALGQMLYRVQAGMDDLAKAKANTSEINNWFLRIQKSIEDTAKRIARIRHPNPLDVPLTPQEGYVVRKKYADAKSAKAARQAELERFFKEYSY